jgi:hypothetical protein
MTARQIIQEIETLPFEEQQAVFASLEVRMKDKEAPASTSTSGSVRYLDAETARPMIKEILTEHAELFRKLAQ